MGEYVKVIDEEFDYPVPTYETALQRAREYRSYTQEERNKYLDLLISVMASTDKGLHRLVKSFKQTDPKFPDAWVILRWLNEDAARKQQYACVKDSQIDMIAEDVIHISDTERDPNRARVRIDARKWVASKLAPKKYGDRLEVEHKGNLNLTAMSDQELMKLYQEQTGDPVLIGQGSNNDNDVST